LNGRDTAYTAYRLFYLEGDPAGELRKPPEQRRSFVRFHGFVNTHRAGEMERNGASGPEVVQTFVPDRAGPSPWRTLTIDVRPDSVRATWQAEDGTTLRLPAFTRAALTKHRDSMQQQLLRSNQLPGVPLELRDWEPRLPLGLYLYRCS